jgi:hypothetical protein
MTASFAWWYRPVMFAAYLIAVVTRMGDERFEKMVKPIITLGVKLRVM